MPKPKPRILCLDDDQDTCEVATALLQSEGYEVVTAETLADALRLIEMDGFSLYIVDEWLPDGEGIDFIRQIRQSGSKTPILVHSANAFQHNVDAAIGAGANEYLVKPEGWKRLPQVVNSLLR